MDFLAGAIVGFLLAMLGSIIVSSPSPYQLAAIDNCQKAGYHGGTFKPELGYVCFKRKV